MIGEDVSQFDRANVTESVQESRRNALSFELASTLLGELQDLSPSDPEVRYRLGNLVRLSGFDGGDLTPIFARTVGVTSRAAGSEHAIADALEERLQDQPQA